MVVLAGKSAKQRAVDCFLT